jgi:hypothetical protein
MGFAHGFSAIVAMPIASDVNLIQRRQQFLIHLMESAQFGGGFFCVSLVLITGCI